jgi:hypothetical protein
LLICPVSSLSKASEANGVHRMQRSAPQLRRGALLIRGPFTSAPLKTRCTASGTRLSGCFAVGQNHFVLGVHAFRLRSSSYG